MVTSFRRSQSVPPTLYQATADPRLHWRLLDTHRQVWVSLLWGHCSFLLGPGAQGSVWALQESVSQSCVSSGGSMAGLMATSPIRWLMPYPRLLHPDPLPLQQATADLYLLKRHSDIVCLSLCGISGSWCTQAMFEPSERLWQVWGLILIVISPLLPYCWGFSFAVGCGVSQSHFSATQVLLQHHTAATPISIKSFIEIGK